MVQPASPFHRRGFTLAELIVVISVTAILAGLAMPRYAAAVNRSKVDAAARRMVADLALVQARAKANSSTQTISFTAGTSQYQINGMSDLDRSSASYVVALAAEPYGVSLSWSGIGNDNSLSFNGYGVPDTLGSFVITRGGYSKTVSIDKDTGAATVQ